MLIKRERSEKLLGTQQCSEATVGLCWATQELSMLISDPPFDWAFSFTVSEGSFFWPWYPGPVEVSFKVDCESLHTALNLAFIAERKIMIDLLPFTTIIFVVILLFVSGQNQLTIIARIFKELKICDENVILHQRLWASMLNVQFQLSLWGRWLQPKDDSFGYIEDCQLTIIIIS